MTLFLLKSKTKHGPCAWGIALMQRFPGDIEVQFQKKRISGWWPALQVIGVNLKLVLYSNWQFRDSQVPLAWLISPKRIKDNRKEKGIKKLSFVIGSISPFSRLSEIVRRRAPLQRVGSLKHVEFQSVSVWKPLYVGSSQLSLNLGEAVDPRLQVYSSQIS